MGSDRRRCRLKRVSLGVDVLGGIGIARPSKEEGESNAWFALLPVFAAERRGRSVEAPIGGPLVRSRRY